MKLGEQDTGCYVGGSWGHYAPARMIQRASEEWGYDDQDVVDLAHKKLQAMMPSSAPALTDAEEDLLIEYANEVEDWLNKNVAADGYFFSWHDGEFFFQSAEWWEES